METLRVSALAGAMAAAKSAAAGPPSLDSRAVTDEEVEMEQEEEDDDFGEDEEVREDDETSQGSALTDLSDVSGMNGRNSRRQSFCSEGTRANSPTTIDVPRPGPANRADSRTSQDSALTDRSGTERSDSRMLGPTVRADSSTPHENVMAQPVTATESRATSRPATSMSMSSGSALTPSRCASRAGRRDTSRLRHYPYDEKDPETVEQDQQQIQQLMRRVWKSDELIKQLKQIVKAQHLKIEELRDRVEQSEKPVVTNIVASQMELMEKKDFMKLKADYESLRLKLSKAGSFASKYKAENLNLKRANRRLQAMLEFTSPRSATTAAAAAVSACFQPSEDSQMELPMTSSFDSISQSPLGPSRDSAYASVTLAPLPPVGGTHTPTTDALTSRSTEFSSPRLCSTAPAFVPGGRRTSAALAPPSPSSRTMRDSPRHQNGVTPLPHFSRLSKLHTVMPTFWKNQLDTPMAVLTSLVEVTGRLLSDRPGTIITLYMIDPWLRQAAYKMTATPAVFYLGQGKAQLQVFQQDGVRPEAPRFEDLTALPARTRTLLAVSVTMPTFHRKMAVLQAHTPEVHSRTTKPALAPKVLKDMLGKDIGSDAKASFTDGQLMCMQLVCSVAGSLLEQIERMEKKEAELGRQRESAEVTVTVNKARSLPDFEQRVKHLLCTFFAVRVVRILFFNAETEELLISSAQTAPIRRKECTAVSINKGIVGLCARRMQVLHVINVAKHPFADAFADGLIRNGKYMTTEASMLVGPMVVDYDEGGTLVGVVQLLDRNKKRSDVGTKASAAGKCDGKGGIDGEAGFSMEEQDFFKQFLRVLAHVAWRMLQVHETILRNSDQPGGLARIVSA
eukprot:TRINITY_DN20827_c0_g1_i1.p1 TRINITY_DN20827_c0_g1~~TRINITY_DN20827_c0_g1_i1.p1  ORF type:complete len:849 (-),score=167.76 TRINITY_DN20827_c0_g1_i1:123-2669(-)